MKKKLTIEGMSCMHCVNHVKKYLEEIDGVSHVEIDLEKGTGILEAEDNVTDQELIAKLEGTGYQIKKVENI